MLGALAGVVLWGSVAGAGGEWATTYAHSAGNHGAFSVTHVQTNSTWLLAGVLWDFGAVPGEPVTVVVTRVSGSGTFVLGTLTVAGVRNVAWAAELAVPFNVGDVLQFSCNLDTGHTQLIRKAE
jgi:hypothetical protein